jgi:DNA-binding protein
MAEEKREEKQKKEPVKEEKTTEAPQTKQVSENTVFVGGKPVMNYVVACMTFFNTGSKKVVVKARGRAISRAVDTVELLKRVFVKDIKLQGISLGTEQVTRREGQKSNVSAIEITVTKP